MRKNCHSSGRTLLFCPSIKRAMKVTAIIGGYHCYQLHTQFYAAFLSQGFMFKKLYGIINVDFDVIDQLLIRYFSFLRYWKNMLVKWDSAPFETFNYCF
jgi:hypothetical protein